MGTSLAIKTSDALRISLSLLVAVDCTDRMIWPANKSKDGSIRQKIDSFWGGGGRPDGLIDGDFIQTLLYLCGVWCGRWHDAYT
jgi:hypothetical protein